MHCLTVSPAKEFSYLLLVKLVSLPNENLKSKFKISVSYLNLHGTPWR